MSETENGGGDGAADHRTRAVPFRYGGEVRPGEKRHLRYEVGETYPGDPVEVPVTVVNGDRPGPRVVVAAVHGGELNGVKVAQEVAGRYDPADLAGTLVVVHVANVPAFRAQQRYIPIYDQDLNRASPGRPGSNTAGRMAHELWEAFLSKRDYGLDLHTSARNRTTMFHLRAQTSDRRSSGWLARSARTSLSRGRATRGRSGAPRPPPASPRTPWRWARPTGSSRYSSRRRSGASRAFSRSTG